MTLIELLVVIAIIGLLAGLLVVGGNTWRKSMKIKQTRATLSILDAIADEFYVQSEGYFSNSVDDLKKFLVTAENVGEIFKFDSLRKNDDGDVIDGWGKPILLYNPNALGDPPTKRPVFWSIGPDEENDSGDGSVGRWSKDDTYIAEAIVIYDSSVYKNVSGGPTATVPGQSNDWKLQDDIGTFK